MDVDNRHIFKQFDNLCMAGNLSEIKNFCRNKSNTKFMWPSSFQSVVQSGNFAVVEWLIRKYPHIQGDWKNRITLLRLACLSNHPNIFKYLCDVYDDDSTLITQIKYFLNKYTCIGFYTWREDILHSACYYGHTETVAYIIERYGPVLYYAYDDNLIFRETCKHNNLVTAQTLLKYYPEINFADDDDDIFCFFCTISDPDYHRIISWFIGLYDQSSVSYLVDLYYETTLEFYYENRDDEQERLLNPIFDFDNRTDSEFEDKYNPPEYILFCIFETFNMVDVRVNLQYKDHYDDKIDNYFNNRVPKVKSAKKN